MIMKHSHMLRKSLLVLTIALLLSAALTPLWSRPASAAHFSIHITREYRVNSSLSSMHITETRTVTTNAANYYIPTTSSELFTIQNFKGELTSEELSEKRDSLTVREQSGSSLYYTIDIENESIMVTVPYPRPVYSGQQFVIQMEYDTSELIEKVGSLTNIYIPGLSETYEEERTNGDTGITTAITYDTYLRIPDEADAPTFTLPQPAAVSKSNSETVYQFDTESILGTVVWHQIGTEQTYYFKLIQPLPATDHTTPETLEFLTKNEYRITLPRDYSENNQNAFYINITPEPDAMELDDDGNLIASFILDATRDQSIVAEGYITTSIDGPSGADIPTSTLEDIPRDTMEKYLQPAQYWESDDPEIIAKAEELMEGTETVYGILKNDYLFIIDSIDYDDFKYGERNERKGALATLRGDSSVCMEYSDLLIALARAQGIPARAAYGYGYDPKYPPSQQEEHQWVQAWVPDYGWLTLDPTWGETGREFIGRDLDHALWYVASADPNDPSPLEVFSGSSQIYTEENTIEIIAVDTIPSHVVLRTADELVEIFEERSNPLTRLALGVQTTYLGRFFVTFLPVCTTLLLVILVVYAVLKVSGVFRKKRKVPAAGQYPT
jgi:transglutaminase-like putative cysteine protease